MPNFFFEYVFLILIILVLVMIANKIRITYPIVLVIGGVALGFTHAFSSVDISPELVFFIFLPPLLYEASWQISWKEFWKWRRVIISFAFPIVIVTSCVVAFASFWLIPGFTLALGFLLGGIISPPDAVSATTIFKQVKVPKALASIAEGESLLNDASSLIVFRFALAAVITGQFHFQDAALSFLLVIVMGTAIGVAIGFIFYYIHRWLVGTASVEIVLTLVTPYCMYYAAEYFHYSGVLAVVSGGLLLSSKRQKMLTYQSRIQGFNVWSNIAFVLNGLVFFLIGLQLPSIIDQLGDISLGTAIWYGVAISLVLIITRVVCTLGASGFTMFMSKFIKVADDSPGWKGPLVLGWAGMRGVVSLAAALSIPLLINDKPFPYRSLILFITFIVILVTLVLQGLTLPWLVRKLKLEDKFAVIPEKKQEMLIQKKLSMVSLQYLTDNHNDEIKKNKHLNNFHSRLSIDLALFNDEINKEDHSNMQEMRTFQEVYLKILDHQRKLLEAINHKEEYDEEIVRKYMTLIDMEEYKVREKILEV